MKYYTTLLLAMTMFFLSADQNLLAPNLSAVAKEFHFSTRERDLYLGGYIAIGFFVIGGPAAVGVGLMSDMHNRCRLFCLVVVFSVAASVSTYWATTYISLLICRTLTGVGVGGATPLIYSLLGDLFHSGQRVNVSTVIGLATGAGITIGQLIAGVVGPIVGWRMPFLFVATPAAVCALLIWLTVDEPARGQAETATVRLLQTQSVAQCTIDYRSTAVASISSTSQETQQQLHYEGELEWTKIKKLFHTPSALVIFSQGLPGCLPWGMVIVFLNDYLSNDEGMSIQLATATLTCFGIGGLAGQLIGGGVGQKLYDHNPAWQCMFMGVTTMLTVPPMIYIINQSSIGTGVYGLALFAGMIVNMNGPNLKAVLQNVCIPEIRGTAFAVFTLTDDIGKGFGPAFVVLFIQAFKGNRRKAFTLVVLFWIVCGLLLCMLGRTVGDDERRAQQHVHQHFMRLTTSTGFSYQQSPMIPPSHHSRNVYEPLKSELQCHTVDEVFIIPENAEVSVYDTVAVIDV